MKRSKGLGLFLVFALFVATYPATPAMASVDHVSITSTASSQNEVSCLAGAKQSCSEEAGLAFLDCADALGLTIEDLESGSPGIYTCAFWGGLAYLWCTITSIF